MWAAILLCQSLSLSPQAALDLFLAEPALQGASLSVDVRSLNGSRLLSFDPKRRLVPASNQKLLTAAYALERLGSGYVTSTSVQVVGSKGLIQTQWDPSWTLDRLKDLRTSFPKVKSWGLSEPFDPTIPPGWELDDLHNRYAAPVSALMIEQNGFELRGNRGKVFLPPEVGLRLRRVPSEEPVQVQVDWLTRVVTVKGKVPQTASLLETLAIPDPHATIGRCLRTKLSTGAKALEGAKATRFPGPGMRWLLTQCLSNSRNLIAEGLLVSAALKEKPIARDPYPESTDRMLKFLTNEVKIPADQLSLADGSGLSRHNLVTAEAITSLLIWVQTRPYSILYRASLARPGQGTLASRLKGIAFEGKTGTSNFTNSLSGYLRLESGQEVIISLLSNHAIASSAEVREAMDRFVVRLSQASFGTDLASTSRSWKQPEAKFFQPAH